MGMEWEAGDNDLISFRKDPEPQQEGGAGNTAQTGMMSPFRRADAQAWEIQLEAIWFPPSNPNGPRSAQMQKEETPHLPRDLFRRHGWRVVTLYTASPLPLFRTRRGGDLSLVSKENQRSSAFLPTPSVPSAPPAKGGCLSSKLAGKSV